MVEPKAGAGAFALADPRTLLGAWEFDRVVIDHLAEEEFSVEGTIEFAVVGDGDISWSERGTMRRAGAKIPISRQLFLTHRVDGWAVTFEDGRDFHRWEPGTGVTHLCGRDTYRGFVHLAPASASSRRTQGWTVTWQVSGPAKNYEMVTRVRRVGSVRPSSRRST